MTQKILAKSAGLPAISAGEFVECWLDLVIGNDVTAPLSIDEFFKMGFKKVFDKDKIALIPDHFTPCKDIEAATLAKKMREFARQMDLSHYYEIGKAGIEHALLPEKGAITPGSVIIGADSHTCTHGALGAFATGVGSTEMAAGMAIGHVWFRAPSAIKVVIKGEKRPYVSGKDVILHLIGILGVDGARYESLEFTGNIAALTMDDRFTMANMVIESGAKNGIFPVDDIAVEYIREHGGKMGQVFAADPDAEYRQEIVIDLADVGLTVAFPHLPENAKTIQEAEEAGIVIDQVVIGSCTNGRMEDMRQAAEILRGRRVADSLRCIIIPATQAVVKQCITEGLFEIFIDAGAVVSTPTCGPCLGGHMGVLAEGERCVATMNRNFVGRMGHVGSEVYLASPVVAAASAVAGRICGPERLVRVES